MHLRRSEKRFTIVVGERFTILVREYVGGAAAVYLRIAKAERALATKADLCLDCPPRCLESFELDEVAGCRLLDVGPLVTEQPDDRFDELAGDVDRVDTV